VLLAKSTEVFSVSIAPCLEPCHDALPGFRGLDDIISDGLNTTYIIEALFQTKMYLLMNKAYARGEGIRWPMFLFGNYFILPP